MADGPSLISPRTWLRASQDHGFTGLAGAIRAARRLPPIAIIPTAGTSADREREWTARLMIVAVLAIRSVHVLQGYLDVATGWHAFRLPVVAVALAVACTIDTVWVAARSWRRGRIDPAAIVVDAAFGAIALAVMGVTLLPGDRTTSLNWFLPFTVGTAVAAGLAMRMSAALTISSVLAAVYLASVWPDIAKGGGPLATAIVNAVSYLGFLCVAAILRTVLLYLVGLLSQARREAVAQGEQLAAERERARQYRLIHDSALQTLEAVAKGWGAGSAQLRQRALRESQRLRLALREDRPGESDHGRSLRLRLGLLIAEFADRGLTVEYVDAELDTSASPAVAEALCEATREALTNVAKHADVTAAVVRAATVGDGIEVSVLDRGRGFESSWASTGFGITNSIRLRIAEVGGRAEIQTAPGKGTLVRLWSPA